MAIFSEPICPHCGQPLPMRELWEFAGYDRLGLLREKSGIVCPQCGTKLRVIQSGVCLSFILPAVAIGTLLGLSSRALRASGVDPKVAIVILLVPLLMFWFRYGPCFARVRPVKSTETLVYPLSRQDWKSDFSDE
jgi:hypothetical protein